VRLPRYHLPEYSSGEVPLIEAVADNRLVAGQLLLTGIAEEKRVTGTLLAGQRDIERWANVLFQPKKETIPMRGRTAVVLDC
jgi:hypothetical protein